MSRRMPPLPAPFRQSVLEAIEVAEAGEIAGASPRGTPVRSAWPFTRVELLYELAYVRIFNEWELFLESTLLRYLCGQHSTHGTVVRTGGAPHCRSLSDAERAFLGGQHYFLWHNPSRVIRRTQYLLTNCPHEHVIASNRVRLEQFANVRHRIVHSQNDAIIKFNNATISLAGRRYPRSRPGKFLRDYSRGLMRPTRWLSLIGDELTNLAVQIA
jgi:hypothetical protein